MEIRGVMDLLGNNGYMKSGHNDVGFMTRSAWPEFSNFSIQFLLTCFKWMQLWFS